MYSTLTTLIDRLTSSTVSKSGVVQWGAPVPSFGNLSASFVATLGLNPSYREFVDKAGRELHGELRRFHTLTSLGIRSWLEVDARHMQAIMESCCRYFEANPYDTWFRKLDKVVLGTKASYYGGSYGACHLDLIPYATKSKWAELSAYQRSILLDIAGDTLGRLLRDSPVRILILNGRSVVHHFENVTDVHLENWEMPNWSLPRRSGKGVRGIAYRGVINKLCGIQLSQEVLVLGFNHNLQSSFGVTNEVIEGIQAWIAEESRYMAW